MSGKNTIETKNLVKKLGDLAAIDKQAQLVG
jgi:hypothetical protein